MPPSSTISSKGQVTVPIEVRHRLGLREGDRVEFVFEEDVYKRQVDWIPAVAGHA